MNGIVTGSRVIKTRRVVYQQLSEEHKKIYDAADLYISNKYNLFCACGKLCTGLHERTCAKFRNAVNREFFKRIGV